ncbi:MAG: EAL domain-containing protein [Gammaproteobacteria bacterium]|nr:EAL domain-containing protein [Gammaproteobacteria bacterium]
MRYGLQNDEFELYYQPQVASNNQMVGCEALLRWHHPEQGMVMPAIFIPIAEDTGLIIQLRPLGAGIGLQTTGQMGR